jgi:hypothetical protein
VKKKHANSLITVNGKTQSIQEWAKENNLRVSLILDRINELGWTSQRAVTTLMAKSWDGNEERQTNPQALGALRALMDQSSNSRGVKSSKGILDAYEVLYVHGPMTRSELNQRGQELKVARADILHTNTIVLEHFGLIHVVGRRKCTITNTLCNVIDVTNAVPVVKPTWNDYNKNRVAKRESHRSVRREGRPSLPPRKDGTPYDVTWLRTAACEFVRILGIMDRTGQHYSSACRKAVAFLTGEANRCGGLSDAAVERPDDD